MMRLLIGILSILVTIISGCVSTQKPFSMDYKTNDTVFHLSQSCIDHITPREKENVIFIKVKNSAKCSNAFNLFWEKSVGGKVSVFFNGEVISKDIYTVTPIHTENGFNQSVKSKTTFDKIINILN
ncbi:hypothetical protein ABLB69_08140 [Xenorhabdus khoisanae]|uniref:hypothetical protein n=1 Tax=Xenorhabdus khoisanae TaxID=880157 RepID=UPI0032B83CCB